jgi:hypothetical protein
MTSSICGSPCCRDSCHCSCSRRSPIRRIPYVCVALFGLALAASLSPLDVSFLKVAGGPKILECCPGAPYRDPDAVKQKQSRGECMFCGDLMPANGTPRWYLVW